jgi:15-cis-phytoene synthase
VSENRAALVAAARESIAKGSKSFAFASTLFDAKTRERAWLLYSWCRACDDLADGQLYGGALSNTHDASATLALIRDRTNRALGGETTGDSAFDALGLVARECMIPHQYANDLVEGFALDAADWRPQNEADLLKYCYHVAGTVGCMMAVIMGVDPNDSETMARANDLGLAFQLANIARDIGEDAEGGRCYLPRDWLDEMGILPGELRARHNRAKLGQLGQRLATMAETYEASARIGARKLPFRSRWAVLSAAGIYGDIAREVARRGEGAWDSRVFTSKVAKLNWVVRAMIQAR